MEIASTILAATAALLVLAVYVIYLKGHTLRASSPFAQQLSAEKSQLTTHRQTFTVGRGSSASKLPVSNPRAHSFARTEQRMRIPGSGTGTPITSRNNSITCVGIRHVVHAKHNQHGARSQEFGNSE